MSACICGIRVRLPVFVATASLYIRKIAPDLAGGAHHAPQESQVVPRWLLPVALTH